MVKLSRSSQQRGRSARCGAVHRQRRQVGQGQVRPAVGEHPHPVLTTQHGGDLEVDQLWRGQRLTAKADASGIPVGAAVGERDCKVARVGWF